MPDGCAASGCTNRRSSTSLQFYCIPTAKRYPKQRIKWVTAMRTEKWSAEKINNGQICSAHFATGNTFRMYSSSLRFQQNEPKNYSNDMNEHKNVEGDQM